MQTGFETIDAYVDEKMSRLKMPGVSLAIVEGDKTVHMCGFGQARPGGEGPSPQTPFFIGSLTKSFTALAVMQLVEAGKIALDAPAQCYLPWFRVADAQASARMTVRHLLNQTSGLPTSSGESTLADFDDSPDATKRQARALSTLVLNHPVGSAFEYSNSNYNLLGLIIEAVSGESYADTVQNQIFTPLEMNHSYASPTVAKENGLAVGHRYWFGFPLAAPNLAIPHGSLPSGQLISCAEDMARYLSMYMNGGRYGDVQIISEAGIAELLRGVADFSAMGLSLGQYGMGWFVDTLGDTLGETKRVWHSGTTPDFAAYMALLPEQKKGLVLLFNADHHWMTPVLSDFGAGAASLLAGKPPSPVPFVDTIPWILRGQLLIPIFQVAGVLATLRLLHGRRFDPECRPSGRRQWSLHVLLPLIANLLIALSLLPMLGSRCRYLKLYMPDYSLIALVCGSFAGAWAVVRTGLIVRGLRKGKNE